MFEITLCGRGTIEKGYHYIDIYNFIYHYIMNGDYSEDLAQDVFICFFEKRIK